MSFLHGYTEPTDPSKRVEEDRQKHEAFNRFFYDKAILEKIQEECPKLYNNLESELSTYALTPFTQRPFLSPAAELKADIISKLFALKYYHQAQVALMQSTDNNTLIPRYIHDMEQIDKIISVFVKLYIP